MTREQLTASIATPRQRKPCGPMNERREPYRTICSCPCGWIKTIFHRNARARASMAEAAFKAHRADNPLTPL